jgi:hypothetical protein
MRFRRAGFFGELFEQWIGLLLFLSENWILREYFFLDFFAFVKKSDVLNSSLLHVRIPMLAAQMANHLHFRLEVFILHSQFGKRIEHHGLTRVGGRLEMFVDDFINFGWSLASLYQVI